VNKIVLDASALLAILNNEPGSRIFIDQPELLAHSIVSAVNLAETHSKLVSLGMTARDAWEAATAPTNEIVDFSAEQAKIAGALVQQTRSLGLSLGDRACLALGIVTKAHIYTADRSWKSLKVNIPIHVIR
jgi:ribonuclease VapC